MAARLLRVSARGVLDAPERMLSGLPVLVFWDPTLTEDSLPLDAWMRWVTPVVALLIVAVGVGCAGVAWWLSGEPIRRWWWRRKKQEGGTA